MAWRIFFRSKILLVFFIGTFTALWIYLSLVAFFWFVVRTDAAPPLGPALGTVAWMVGQWSPAIWSQFLSEVGWKSFERTCHYDPVAPLEIPILDLTIATIRNNPIQHLLHAYGDDWTHRPLLIKGVWSKEELQDPNRRLSISGLAQDPLVVPYFSDARQLALSPDSEDSLIHILEGIRQGRPHKIGSQEYVKAYPDRLGEVAPPTLVSTLFGNRFTVDRLLGHIYSPLSLLQGPLTVPIFVANANIKSPDAADIKKVNTTDSSSTCRADRPTASTSRPFTGLHCEPIGNISVQLAGAREWTLVQPAYWKWLRPTVSPDSRGFFASWAPTIDHVPRYRLRTLPGDAVWVPPWTWHRVDYVVAENQKAEDNNNEDDNEDDDGDTKDRTVALGASLFHFRPVEFVTRNPVFALLLAPYLAGELLGTKTQ